MSIFRKRRKFGNFRGPPVDSEPLPDIVYQMGAEQAERYVRLRASSPNPHDHMESAASGIVYSLPHPSMAGGEYFYDEAPYQAPNEVARSSSSDFLASLFGLNRSKSRQQRASRPKDRFVPVGSPVHFQEHPSGTPVKYRHRPASPDFALQRAGSPYHFAEERVGSPYHFAEERVPSPLHFVQNSRPSSPDVMRRLHRAQLSQDLQRIEKQQRQQQQQLELMMANSVPLIPQYPYAHQPYYPMANPNINMQGFPVLQAPEMYAYH